MFSWCMGYHLLYGPIHGRTIKEGGKVANLDVVNH